MYTRKVECSRYLNSSYYMIYIYIYIYTYISYDDDDFVSRSSGNRHYTPMGRYTHDRAVSTQFKCNIS